MNWHPGDKGMAAIADIIWGALRKELARPAKAPGGVTGIVPEPQEATVSGKPDFTWKPGTTLHAPPNPGEVLKHGIDLLANDFRELRQLDLPVQYDLPAGTTELRLSSNPDFSVKSVAPDKGYDAYALTVDPEGIELAARTEAGLFYGLQTLRQLFRPAGNAPSIVIRDWAAQRWRVVYGMPWETSAFLDKLARLKINMCIVESPWNAARNWWFNPSPDNRAKAEELFRLAAQSNIEVVPLVQGGGWAYGVIDQNPNCAEGIWVPKAPVTFTVDTVDFPERNVIRTQKMPVIVSSPDGKTVYAEGRDYEIMPGVTRRPFPPDNAPWKLRRLAKGAILPGATVNVDYNYRHEIRALDLGKIYGDTWRYLRIPRLEEVLELCDGSAGLNIHMKMAGKNGELVRQVAEALAKYNLDEAAYIGGEADVLEAAIRFAPDITRSCMAEQHDPDALIRNAVKFNCRRLQFYSSNVTAAHVAEAHKHGIHCNVFYADTREEARRMVEMGINTVLTNYAATFLNAPDALFTRRDRR